MTSPSEKPDEAHIEETRPDDIDLKVGGYDTDGLVKSRFDELSIFRTLWVFKRVILVSLAVYTGYICEGFEVSQGPLPRNYTRGVCSHGYIYELMRYSSALEVVSSQMLASSNSLVQRVVQA